MTKATITFAGTQIAELPYGVTQQMHPSALSTAILIVPSVMVFPFQQRLIHLAQFTVPFLKLQRFLRMMVMTKETFGLAPMMRPAGL
jgi:hypothetical protein